MNDGDWICSDANCGNINFARRVSCYRCNKDRPDAGKISKKKLGTEIGKSAAEKSRGLFNADDWQCNKCANVNWARRQTCNVCNAPKFGEVEARTGYGGGYNERGVVEYRRREPSSDDEYDEFGRKKRKRKSEAQDKNKVGITEGAVLKKLSPTMLEKESNVEYVMPAPGIMPLPNNEHSVNLSDGSMRDITSLSKAAFRKSQLQSQTNYQKQDNMLPVYKCQYPPNKRFKPINEREQPVSTCFDIGKKRIKRDSTEVSGGKSYNPVMENRVSSTNSDNVVYTFTGPTPKDDFQVTYTVEERVKAAAFAIVFHNCKISTDKFESLYDKPAPDFKTIFAWRHRLLTTGCLVDSHLDNKKDIEKSPAIDTNISNTPKINNHKNNKKVPNPDEIYIATDSEEEIPVMNDKNDVKTLKRDGVQEISDTDDDNRQIGPAKNNLLHSTTQRSDSVETMLVLTDHQKIPSIGRPVSPVVASLSTRGVKSYSKSPHNRTHSSSQVSQDSNFSDSDFENIDGKLSTKNKPILTAETSVDASNSDSISYNSDEENFLSRVYGEKRKTKRKMKKRSNLPTPRIPSNYVTNNEQSFQGYRTMKMAEQSPLTTGNIYTSNLRHMGIKQNNNVVDVDGYTSEYVPTRLGSTAMKNYQEFKDNVRKKGFWAKGNGTSMPRNVYVSSNGMHNEDTSKRLDSVSNDLNRVSILCTSTNKSEFKNCTTSSPIEIKPYNSQNTQQKVVDNRNDDFTKDDLQNCVTVNNYLPFDKNNLDGSIRNNENVDRIFAVVQTNSVKKNASIMDIFDTNATGHKSPEEHMNKEKYDSRPKIFETEWDDDDDALYINTEPIEESIAYDNLNSPAMGSNSMRSQSPTSSILYATNKEYDSQEITKHSYDINDKQEKLSSLLKDLQGEKQISDSIESNKNNDSESLQQSKYLPKSLIQNNSPTDSLISQSEGAITLVPTGVTMLNSLGNTTNNKVTPNKVISPSKQVRVLESITIVPNQQYLNLQHQEQVRPQLPTTTVANSHVSEKSDPSKKPPDFDLSNLLAGINTNTLLLALQNLQELTQSTTVENNTSNNDEIKTSDNANRTVNQVETINLTNDEEWEKESNRDGSIERMLEKLDGTANEETPFLSDIFDPGPVVIPPNVAKKLNINLKLSEECNEENVKSHINENAPVIGNFKSFALPKPILLNRLKLSVKNTDKPMKNPENKRIKRRRKSKVPTSSQGDGEDQDEGDDDEEESGDDADLSKYDLWGSDEENANSSKNCDADKTKEGEGPKEDATEEADKNGKSSPEAKSKRRSRSSSTTSSSSSSSSSSHSSSHAPKNKFDDFNLNSERETSPKEKSRSRSRSPRPRSGAPPMRRKSRDSRSAGESRSSRDKEWSRDRERRDRSRGGGRDDRKQRRYSREGGGNHYGARGRHR